MNYKVLRSKYGKSIIIILSDGTDVKWYLTHVCN